MPDRIRISIKTKFIEEQSSIEENRFVYAYNILIENIGREAAQLISRKWTITDAKGAIQEVQGLGVIGEQPRIEPGQSYRYTSGAVLATDSGIMEGEYTMQQDDGTEFSADIPAFSLVKPSALH
ncbi:MAG: ApaG protein [Flavobacteriales bacterium]|jgi:ApaG protein